MPALNSKDMTNPASGGPYAGESRDAIFQLKVKEKRPFILGSSKNGKEVIGVKYEKNKKTLSYYIGNKKIPNGQNPSNATTARMSSTLRREK